MSLGNRDECGTGDDLVERGIGIDVTDDRGVVGLDEVLDTGRALLHDEELEGGRQMWAKLPDPLPA